MKFKLILAAGIALFIVFAGCVQFQGTQAKDCKEDIGCFNAEFKQCKQATVTVKQAEEGFESSLLFESKGAQGENCLLYGKLTEIMVSAEGADDSTQQLVTLFNDLKGKEMNCSFTKTDAGTVNVFLEDFEMEKYCTGSLVTAMSDLSKNIEKVLEESLEEETGAVAE